MMVKKRSWTTALKQVQAERKSVSKEVLIRAALTGILCLLSALVAQIEFGQMTLLTIISLVLGGLASFLQVLLEYYSHGTQ